MSDGGDIPAYHGRRALKACFSWAESKSAVWVCAACRRPESIQGSLTLGKPDFSLFAGRWQSSLFQAGDRRERGRGSGEREKDDRIEASRGQGVGSRDRGGAQKVWVSGLIPDHQALFFLPSGLGQIWRRRTSQQQPRTRRRHRTGTCGGSTPSPSGVSRPPHLRRLMGEEGQSQEEPL